MAEKENIAKELRRYLKQFTICERRIGDLERVRAKLSDSSARYAAVGCAIDMERDKLVQRCGDVLFILGFLPSDSLARQILDSLYLKGRTLKQIAFELRYSYGYCANVEAAAMKELAKVKEVRERIAGITAGA